MDRGKHIRILVFFYFVSSLTQDAATTENRQLEWVDEEEIDCTSNERAKGHETPDEDGNDEDDENDDDEAEDEGYAFYVNKNNVQ